MPAKASILVVDDSPTSALLLASILRAEGYEVSVAESGERALDTFAMRPPDMILRRNAETQAVLKQMQARMGSVVLLNEVLYKTESYTHVKLADYLRQIATHVFQAQNARTGAVRLVLDLAAVEVETRMAIPCGLIVNELMTNSLKHAFSSGSEGEIRVSLHAGFEGTLQLRVSDTGAGLPADFATRPRTSLGLQLVSDLAKQLRGALEVGPASAFTITFPSGSC